MRIAVFGDSILWGQGLPRGQKTTASVVKALQDRQQRQVETTSFAHSGSDVWHDGEGDLDILNPLPAPLPPLRQVPSRFVRDHEKACSDAKGREEIGEIPSEIPFTLRQIDKASAELARGLRARPVAVGPG